MRVIYLHQYFNDPSMPGGTRSHEVAARLAVAGHEVHVITSDRTQRTHRRRTTEKFGYTTHWFGVPYSNNMSAAKRIHAFSEFGARAAHLAYRLAPDVVFATSTPLTIALPGIYASSRARVPMVFEVRDLWPEMPIAAGYLDNRMLQWCAFRLERFAYSHSARIIALSSGMKAGVVDTGYPEEHVDVIPNAADLAVFDVPEASGLRFRKQFDWLQDRPLVVYAGSVGFVNDLTYLVDLAGRTLELEPSVRFVVIGTGAEEGLVRSLAAANGTLNRNLFMMPPIPKRELPAVLSAASIVLSLFRPIPQMDVNSANKFFDALAAARPIAINYGGWQRDLLHSTGAGIALPPGAPAAAADLLLAALADDGWLQGAGQAARELAISQFSRDELADATRHCLERAVRDFAGASERFHLGTDFPVAGVEDVAAG